MIGKWKEAVVFTDKEGSKKGSTETCLVVNFEDEGTGAELVQGLYHASLLEEPLARLVNDLKQHFLEPLLTKNCKLRMSESSLTLIHLNTNITGSDPCLAFSQLRELLSFLSVRLDCALDPTSDSSTLLSAISPLLAPWLCDQLVRHVLAPGNLLQINRACFCIHVRLPITLHTVNSPLRSFHHAAELKGKSCLHVV